RDEKRGTRSRHAFHDRNTRRTPMRATIPTTTFRSTTRRMLTAAGALALGFSMISNAYADWVYGNVTEIAIYSNGDSSDKVVVVGTFNTGCPTPNQFAIFA